MKGCFAFFAVADLAASFHAPPMRVGDLQFGQMIITLEAASGRETATIWPFSPACAAWNAF